MILATSSEIWILTLNRIVLVGLAVVSYLADRHERTSSLLQAIFGFGMKSLGLIIELAYEIGIKGSFSSRKRKSSVCSSSKVSFSSSDSSSCSTRSVDADTVQSTSTCIDVLHRISRLIRGCLIRFAFPRILHR